MLIKKKKTRQNVKRKNIKIEENTMLGVKHLKGIDHFKPRYILSKKIPSYAYPSEKFPQRNHGQKTTRKLLKIILFQKLCKRGKKFHKSPNSILHVLSTKVTKYA